MRTRLFTIALLLASAMAQAQSLDLEQYLNATEENPYDLTALVSNASCTANYGWSRHGQDAASNYNCHKAEFASSDYDGYGIESWYWSPVISADLIWQDANLLPGTYRISAYVVARIYNDSSKAGQNGSGTYFFAGDSKAEITSATWQSLTVECTVEAGVPLRIGITAGSDNVNDWVSIAQVKVLCIAPGTPEEIGLSEDYDVNVIRGDTYANVYLKRTIPTSSYTTLCLPFDVTAAQASEFFAEVLKISEITSTDGLATITATARTENLSAGETYLVKGKSDTDDLLVFRNVLVKKMTPATTALDGTYSLTGSFRQLECVDGAYQLQTDGKTFKQDADYSRLSAYSGWMTK